jgi:hypothetical protein
MWSGRAPAATVLTKDGCGSCCCWRPLRLRGSYGWRQVWLQRRMVAVSSACSDLGLLAAAVAAPAAEGGGCDCGWGLCGSCCCWWPLQLTAGGECVTAAAGGQTGYVCRSCGCGSCRWQLSCGCGCVFRLLWPLPLASATGTVATYGCGCCLAAPAASDGCCCGSCRCGKRRL